MVNFNIAEYKEGEGCHKSRKQMEAGEVKTSPASMVRMTGLEPAWSPTGT